MTWRRIADDPTPPETEVLAYYPKHQLTDDGDPGQVILGKGCRCVSVMWPNGQWDEPSFLNYHGEYFGDDYIFSMEPTMWQPLEDAPSSE